jgi:hypothetical protein
MKRILLALAVAFRLSQPQAQAAAPVEAGVCLLVVVVVGTVGVSAAIHACSPSYGCISDPENPGTNWCSTMTRTTAKASGLVRCGPNFKTYEACMRICATNTVADTYTEPDWVVETSYNLVDWTAQGLLEPDFNGEIVWNDPEPVGMAKFYRVKVVPQGSQ